MYIYIYIYNYKLINGKRVHTQKDAWVEEILSLEVWVRRGGGGIYSTFQVMGSYLVHKCTLRSIQYI